MAIRATTTRTRSSILAAVVVLTLVLSHAIIAALYVPAGSDIPVYKSYAEAVARGNVDGTSFAIARDRNIQDAARRNERADPASEDFLIEYPPLAVLWMAAAGIGSGYDATVGTLPDDYDLRFRLVTFAAELLLLIVMFRWAAPALLTSPPGAAFGPWRVAIYAVSTLILCNLLFARLDLVVGALVLAGVVALVRGGWLPGFLILAIAINFKAAPIALAPLWILASLPSALVVRMRMQPGPLLWALVGRTIALAGLTAIVFLPFLITEGARSLDFVRFRGIQGVHVESVPGSILLILHQFGLPLDLIERLGTLELETPLSAGFAAASPVLLLVAVVAIAVLYIRAATASRAGDPAAGSHPATASDATVRLATDRPALFLTATIATLLATLVTSKLLSPQYLLWVLPLVPLLDVGLRRTRDFQIWFVLTCLVTTAIFPYLLVRTVARLDPGGHGYLDPTLLGVGLIVARDALLVWLSWLAIRPLLWPPSDAASRAVEPGTRR